MPSHGRNPLHILSTVSRALVPILLAHTRMARFKVRTAEAQARQKHSAVKMAFANHNTAYFTLHIRRVTRVFARLVTRRSNVDLRSCTLAHFVCTHSTRSIPSSNRRRTDCSGQKQFDGEGNVLYSTVESARASVVVRLRSILLDTRYPCFRKARILPSC